MIVDEDAAQVLGLVFTRRLVGYFAGLKTMRIKQKRSKNRNLLCHAAQNSKAPVAIVGGSVKSAYDRNILRDKSACTSVPWET